MGVHTVIRTGRAACNFCRRRYAGCVTTSGPGGCVPVCFIAGTRLLSGRSFLHRSPLLAFCLGSLFALPCCSLLLLFLLFCCLLGLDPLLLGLLLLLGPLASLCRCLGLLRLLLRFFQLIKQTQSVSQVVHAAIAAVAHAALALVTPLGLQRCGRVRVHTAA